MVKQITYFKDGNYRCHARVLGAGEGPVILGFDRGRKRHEIEIPLQTFEKHASVVSRYGWYNMIVSDNGNKICFERVFTGRRGKMRARRAEVMAQILAEEFGSVEGFLQFNELPVKPGSIQQNMYAHLKQGQKKIGEW